MKVIEVTTYEELLRVYDLRRQVYVVQEGFDASTVKDDFERVSGHLLVVDEHTGVDVATVRVTPTVNDATPLDQYVSLEEVFTDIREYWGEDSVGVLPKFSCVSMLAIDRQFRRKKGLYLLLKKALEIWEEQQVSHIFALAAHSDAPMWEDLRAIRLAKSVYIPATRRSFVPMMVPVSLLSGTLG